MELTEARVLRVRTGGGVSSLAQDRQANGRYQGMRRSTSDDGFSLVELLIVIVVLGFLSAIVVFSVRGITDRGESSACSEDARILATAVESYFAQTESSVIPALGASDGQEYERSLVNAELLRDVSAFYEVDADGEVTPEADGPC